MKIVIFDVGDGSSALVVCPNGYSMMIDCGVESGLVPPVEQILLAKTELGMREYNNHLLTLLHVTHPDDDHVNGTELLMEKMPPFLVHRNRHENFSYDQHINEHYKKKIDLKYRGNPISFTGWGFDQNKIFNIPLHTVQSDPTLRVKEKNNSSILRYVSYAGVSILFGGDMETPGWDWLASNHADFIQTMRNGLSILIAPHHGHNSGFPQSLFNLTGNVHTVIHSKASEENVLVGGTNVSSRYGSNANGIKYVVPTGKIYSGKILTTRSNGNIVIEVSDQGSYQIHTRAAAGRHNLIGTI